MRTRATSNVDPKRPWRLMVDLSLLRPGGESGGVKPFIFENLKWLAEQEGDRITFIFLTWSCSHEDVRAIARPWDELICVRHSEPERPDNIGTWRSNESYQPQPPPDFALQMKADLIYNPIGTAEFYCPGVPLLVSIVDLLHRDYPMTLPPAAVVHREQIFTELAQVADAFQCISDFTARQLHHHYAIEPERVFRTYIAAHERLLREPVFPRAQGQTPYFLYPANAWQHKNHLTLLVAYQLYRNRAGKEACDLVLTGHPDAAMAEIMQTAAALGLEGHVRHEGHLSPGEFRSVWERATALVFASLYEGFGIPLVEAMHHRVPIICSNEGSIPEVAGDAALIVDTRRPEALAEAMFQMANDPALRTELIEKGSRRLVEFTIEREGAILLEHCRRLLTAPRRLCCRGIYADGWTEPRCVIGLPSSDARAQVVLSFGAMPASRRVRIFHAQEPLGAFTLTELAARELVFTLHPSGLPIVVEVVDATNLNPDDARIHGVILAAVRIDFQDDHTLALWPRAT